MDLIFESQKLVECFCCTPFRLDFVEEFLPYDFEGAIMVARDDDIFLFECGGHIEVLNRPTQPRIVLLEPI